MYEVQQAANETYLIKDTSTTEINAISLHDALPISVARNTTAENQARPYFSKFPYLSNINMVRNSDSGNYDALQATLSQHRSEEHTSELQSHVNLVCRLLLEKKNEVKAKT